MNDEAYCQYRVSGTVATPQRLNRMRAMEYGIKTGCRLIAVATGYGIGPEYAWLCTS